MEELVAFLAKGLASKPEDVHVSTIEGETVVILELQVDPEDMPRIIGSGGANIRAMRQVLSAASGRRKTVLELIDQDAKGAEE